MIAIPSAVKKIVNKSPYIRDGIYNDLINLSGLARKIQPEVESICKKKTSEGAVMMALKRLSEEIKYTEKVNKIDYSTFVDEISIKSNLIERTYTNSSSLQNRLSILTENIGSNYFTFIKGTKQTTIIASSNLKDEIESILKNENTETSIDNLSAVIISMSNNHIDSPGLIAFLLNQVAWLGINLVEAVSTFDELSIIIEDKHVEEVFSAFHNLVKR